MVVSDLYNINCRKMTEKNILVAVFLLGVTWAQLDAGQGFELPPGFQGMEREQVQDFMNKLAAAFKDKCETNGGSNAYDNAENALKKLHMCIAEHINGTVLIREVELAKPTGTIDEVFRKYCYRRPKYMACFNETVQGAKACFSSEEQGSLKIMLDVIERLLEFVCFRDGDTIEQFIVDGGPECIMDKLELLRTCARSTFGEITFDVNHIPDITFTDKQCGQLAVLQPCVVSAFTTCPRRTVARTVDSLFNSLRMATPCEGSHKTHEKQTESAESSGKKHMDYLMQRKLELEIRSAELEIWNRENQLGVKHTILTSDVQKN